MKKQVKPTLKKYERLKSRKLIDQIFAQKGQSKIFYPIRVVWLISNSSSTQAILPGFSVPKRNIKTAVARNKIKRQMREAYRLQKPQYYPQLPEPLHQPKQTLTVMFIYLDKTPTSHAVVAKSMQRAWRFLVKQVSRSFGQ